MRIQLLIFIWGAALLSASPACSREQVATDIESLRSAITELRHDYESRIRALEQRVAAAEQQARDAAGQADSVATAQQTVVMSSASRGAGGLFSNAFNPAIGVTFQGQAWAFRHDPETYRIPGFPLGGEAGPVADGLGLGETELTFSANVDDKFSAWLTAPIAIEDGEAGIEIEEAWIETTALPAGLAARFGRFFSGIGYLNSRHAHSWDFLDQPLPYQAFLGEQYLDDGVQVRWLAPTDLFLELGGEVLRGARYPAGGSTDSGFGTQTLYVKLGGDAGGSSSWLAGLSYLHAGSEQRAAGDEDAPLLFTGDTDLAIAQLVWKWAPQGNWKQRNLVIQGEFLWRNEDGDYELPDGRTLDFDGDQSGWYLQAAYQPFPRWRFGARFDTLSSDDPGPLFIATDLAPEDGDPQRYSLMIDWSHSEFSRLRLQYTRDEAGLRSDDQWGLQYIYSIGAHGAHTF